MNGKCSKCGKESQLEEYKGKYLCKLCVLDERFKDRQKDNDQLEEYQDIQDTDEIYLRDVFDESECKEIYESQIETKNDITEESQIIDKNIYEKEQQEKNKNDINVKSNNNKIDKIKKILLITFKIALLIFLSLIFIGAFSVLSIFPILLLCGYMFNKKLFNTMYKITKYLIFTALLAALLIPILQFSCDLYNAGTREHVTSQIVNAILFILLIGCFRVLGSIFTIDEHWREKEIDRKIEKLKQKQNYTYLSTGEYEKINEKIKKLEIDKDWL